MQSIYFGRADELIKEKNPNEEEQLPATQNDVVAAKHVYDADPTEAHGQTYVNALRRSGLYDEAFAFAKANLIKKPKFTIDGF